MLVGFCFSFKKFKNFTFSPRLLPSFHFFFSGKEKRRRLLFDVLGDKLACPL